jgi:hypothetical protein
VTAACRRRSSTANPQPPTSARWRSGRV